MAAEILTTEGFVVVGTSSLKDVQTWLRYALGTESLEVVGRVCGALDVSFDTEHGPMWRDMPVFGLPLCLVAANLHGASWKFVEQLFALEGPAAVEAAAFQKLLHGSLGSQAALFIQVLGLLPQCSLERLCRDKWLVGTIVSLASVEFVQAVLPWLQDRLAPAVWRDCMCYGDSSLLLVAWQRHFGSPSSEPVLDLVWRLWPWALEAPVQCLVAAACHDKGSVAVGLVKACIPKDDGVEVAPEVCAAAGVVLNRVIVRPFNDWPDMKEFLSEVVVHALGAVATAETLRRAIQSGCLDNVKFVVQDLGVPVDQVGLGAVLSAPLPVHARQGIFGFFCEELCAPASLLSPEVKVDLVVKQPCIWSRDRDRFISIPEYLSEAPCHEFVFREILEKYFPCWIPLKYFSTGDRKLDVENLKHARKNKWNRLCVRLQDALEAAQAA